MVCKFYFYSFIYETISHFTQQADIYTSGDEMAVFEQSIKYEKLVRAVLSSKTDK